METMKITPLDKLRQLALEYNKQRYPNFPDHARVTPAYSDKTANGLTKCIIDFLRFNGHQAERVNSTGRVIDTRKRYTDILGHTRIIGSTKWIPTAGSKGTSDISATIAGKSVKIEFKIGKDRQSDYQRQYQAEIEKAGGVYFIAKSFQQFYEWYLQTFERGAK